MKASPEGIFFIVARDICEVMLSNTVLHSPFSFIAFELAACE